MRNKIILILAVVLFINGCEKELDIRDFSDDFSFYQSELRIEALMLPSQNTAIVRIDRSVRLDEANLYNCQDDDLDWNYYYCNSDSISYESKSECLEACGNESDCILHSIMIINSLSLYHDIVYCMRKVVTLLVFPF